MRRKNLSDSDIINGFRKGDSDIIHKYFYEYCQIAYHIYDRQYHLSDKENLDFMSLAHQYAIYLMEHDWKPLEDHSPEVSLKTWFINGFHFVVLDALKWYRKEYGSITFDDYLQSFDVTSDLRLQFNQMVLDICDHAHLNRNDRMIIHMLLLQGFKANEVAAQLGMTPSAISQKYKKLKETIIYPYFKQYFDLDADMTQVMDEQAIVCAEMVKEEPTVSYMRIPKQKRTTPALVTELQPNEIFVFGSNLKGVHGGGAAYIALRKFGAIMGQGVGLQGQSYAIPTMQGGVDTIRPYVDEFIEFAKHHKNSTFLVTRIGCGIAGFTDEDIAPLFEKGHEVDNIILPEGW